MEHPGKGSQHFNESICGISFTNLLEFQRTPLSRGSSCAMNTTTMNTVHDHELFMKSSQWASGFFGIQKLPFFWWNFEFQKWRKKEQDRTDG